MRTRHTQLTATLNEVSTSHTGQKALLAFVVITDLHADTRAMKRSVAARAVTDVTKLATSTNAHRWPFRSSDRHDRLPMSRRPPRPKLRGRGDGRTSDRRHAGGNYRPGGAGRRLGGGSPWLMCGHTGVARNLRRHPGGRCTHTAHLLGIPHSRGPIPLRPPHSAVRWTGRVRLAAAAVGNRLLP